MNISNKIIILFLIICFVSEIAFFSWRIIRKDNQQNNFRSKKDPCLFWIIIGIIIFLIVIDLLLFIKSLEEKPNLYKKWVCGAVIEDNKIKIVLCRKWDPKKFIKQIFDHDIQQKVNNQNLHNENLKIIYNDLARNKKIIYDSLQARVDILKNITAQLLIKIRKIRYVLKENTDYEDYKEFLILASSFNKEKKRYQDRQIVLIEDVIKIKKQSYLKVTEEFKKDFKKKNSWYLFKQIMNKILPTAHYYRKDVHNQKVTVEPLFKYSYAFCNLVFKINTNFENFLGQYIKEYPIIENVEQLKNDLKRIETFL